MSLSTRALSLAIILDWTAVAPQALAQAPNPSARPATAAPSVPPKDGEPRTPSTFPRHHHLPHLSPEQREQAAKLRRQTLEKLAPHRERLAAKRRELRVLWASDPPNRAAILEKLGEIDTIDAAMRPILVDSRIMYLALLTQEQRQALRRPPQPRHCPECGPRKGHGHDAAMPPRPDGPMRCSSDIDGGGLDDGWMVEMGMPCQASEILAPPTAPASNAVK